MKIYFKKIEQQEEQLRGGQIETRYSVKYITPSVDVGGIVAMSDFLYVSIIMGKNE